MSLVAIKYILILSNDSFVSSQLEHICKRLGVRQLKCCSNSSQAISKLHSNHLPDLIIEDLQKIDPDYFFTNIQKNHRQNSLVPVPVFALISPHEKYEIELIKNSDYISYELNPFNETLLEQKIRNLYYESYSYDESGVLVEVVEQYLKNNQFKLAYKFLIPSLRLKPENHSYLVLYAKILFEKKEYLLAENILRVILNKDLDNIAAKNLLSKIFLATERYDEDKKLLD